MRLSGNTAYKKNRCILTLVFLLFFTNVLSAQDFPAGDFWSLNVGLGMSDFLVKGISFQLIIDPKLWLTNSFMIGSKMGINYSSEDHSSATLGNILTFEGQVYARWNFLRFGRSDNPFNVFTQVGIGLVSAYRGRSNPFDDVTETRGSLLGDIAIGVTIPLTPRWHIEPSIRGGYPHIWGFSITAGYKFPLPKNVTKTTTLTALAPGQTRTELIEIIRTLPPEIIMETLPPEVIVNTLPPEVIMHTLPASEIIKRIMIMAVEFVLFGPDMERYNAGIDADAQQLNELVLNQTAQFLNSNPNTIVRIEGHVNPYTVNHYEIDELSVLSSMRANVVADELRARGVKEEQMVIISFGGSRTITNEFDIRNRNRRVELIIIQVDTN